jgi:lipoprotein signal peptidase
MSHQTAVAAPPAFHPEPDRRPRRRWIVFAPVALVVLLDQTTKWWASRQVPKVVINHGGDILVGPVIGRWYAGPVTGALLDLLSIALLSSAAGVLLRRRLPILVTASAALAIGGWTSNLLDRLGLHAWTVPGTVRGALDFIPLAGYYYNIADVFIVVATPLFVLSVGWWLAGRAGHRRAGLPAPGSTGTPAHPRAA